jgi:predicted GIY-YIG superfamily endonuclease
VTGSIDPRRLTTVYRLYDDNGRLLYVGTSVDPQERWEQHARNKLWWSSVSRASVEWYATRTEAMAAERAAIQGESPLFNDKATDDEMVIPYQGNRGPSEETKLRRASNEYRRSLDRLAVATNRAALTGMPVASIAQSAGLSEDNVHELAHHLARGGGLSHIAAPPSEPAPE